MLSAPNNVAPERLPPARPEFPAVFGSRRGYGLPLHVRNRIGSATGQRDYVIPAVTRTPAARLPGGGAGVLALKFLCYLAGSVLSRREGA
jgi:hypothetical protein